MGAFEHYLKLLEPYLKKKGLIEVCINEPGRVWVETSEGFTSYKDKKLIFADLERLARTLATRSGQVFDASHPILSTSLPGYGYRVQVLGNIVASGISFTIRAALARSVDLASYDWFWWEEEATDKCKPKAVKTAFAEGDLEKIHEAVASGKNILVGGGTGQGKTTLLNSLIPLIPMDSRIITVEDAAELALPLHENKVSIVFSRTGTDLGQVSQNEIINSLVRMRPDRIIYGETSVHNADAILNMNNSGHAGGMTTVHADNPEKCLLKFEQYLRRDGKTGDRNYIAIAWDYILTVKEKRYVYVMKV